MNEDSTNERVLSRSYFERLNDMPFFDRCIVLGIVMDVSEKDIALALNMTRKELLAYIETNDLRRWYLWRAWLSV